MSFNDYEFTVVHNQMMQVHNRDWYVAYAKLDEQAAWRRRMLLKRLVGGTARLFRRVAGFARRSESETGTSDRPEKIESGAR